MSFFDDYFDRMFCINLDRSVDRWAHVKQQVAKFELTKVERFRGVDWLDYQHMPPGIQLGMKNAMCGCTASHGAVLHAIGYHEWDKVLVLEDDFEIVHDDFHERFEALIKFVPDDWEMIYLGAHYGNAPRGRVNEHVLLADQIKTTSSYAIRGRYARFVAPLMAGCCGPDDLFSGFNPVQKVYVLQPRLMVQYANTSVIWGKFTDNGQSMLDPHHEALV